MSILDKIHYQILGTPSSNVPLVFLHGLMGYGLNWRRIAANFQSDRQVLIFDQRGHGKSFKPDCGYRPEDYADDLALILDELEWSTIDLIGHSMGGRNGLNFAYRFPMRVRRFVIEDIGPEVAPGSLERIQKMVHLVPVPFASKLIAKEFFLNEFPKQIKDDAQGATLGQYFYANMAEQADGSVQWRFNIEAIMSSLIEGRRGERWVEWENLTMPVLVVRGEHSEDLPRETFQEMLSRNRLSRGIELSGAGHWVHFDRPEEFTRVVRQFLDCSEAQIFRQDFDFLCTSG
jgi:pimeloyl-ACP methyl ester carboxylesterase